MILNYQNNFGKMQFDTKNSMENKSKYTVLGIKKVSIAFYVLTRKTKFQLTKKINQHLQTQVYFQALVNLAIIIMQNYPNL